MPVQILQTSSEEEVVREVAAEVTLPFDLESEPLMRAKLLTHSFPWRSQRGTYFNDVTTLLETLGLKPLFGTS